MTSWVQRQAWRCAHDKGLELTYGVQPDVPDALQGDPGRLRQILVNLVGNAIKFTTHGEVVVEVETVRPPATEGQHDAGTASCCLHFVVRDTGIGIPLDKQRLIFEPFTQADGSTTRQYAAPGSACNCQTIGRDDAGRCGWRAPSTRAVPSISLPASAVTSVRRPASVT